MTGEYVEAFRSPDGRTLIEHLGGVSWSDAPIPLRFHKCKTQTRGWTNYLTETRRCACGAVSLDGSDWIERNSR